MAENNRLDSLRQKTIDISTIALAELSGIGRNRLSSYLSGSYSLPAADILTLHRTFDDLELVITAGEPFPVSFQNVARIRDLIRRARLGEFDKVGS
jgi:hypothetical protein